MRLVSLNTWKSEGDYPKRLQAMIDGLGALSADVIALQEDWRTCDEQTHTARSLATALSMHLTWVSARLKLRSVGQTSVLSTAGLAVLSRGPVLEQRVIPLPQDPRDGERLAQCVRLADDSQPWWLANVHLTHLRDRSDLRQAQLRQALEGMDEIAGGLPIALCGDFNAEPSDQEIAQFLQPMGPLCDACAGIANKVTHKADPSTAQNLDHILLRTKASAPAWAIAHVQVALDNPDVHGVHPSDHFAVCADLYFKN